MEISLGYFKFSTSTEVELSWVELNWTELNWARLSQIEGKVGLSSNLQMTKRRIVDSASVANSNTAPDLH